jgi:hypothetical protein
MSAGKIIAYISAAILILFGVLFVWSAFTTTNQHPENICVGVITIAIGFGLIWFASRSKPSTSPQNVTLQVDLPANVAMDTLKCQSCGGVLKPENITMVAGAPVVTCPYCGTTYQLTEEPKW